MRRNTRRPRPRNDLGFIRVRGSGANVAWWMLSAVALYGAYRAGRYVLYGTEPAYTGVPHARDVFG
jgi:hypothetical protein